MDKASIKTAFSFPVYAMVIPATWLGCLLFLNTTSTGTLAAFLPFFFFSSNPNFNKDRAFKLFSLPGLEILPG